MPALVDLPSPYSKKSTHSCIEKRDQEIALLAYRLRCAEDDKNTLQRQLERCVRAGGPAYTP